MLSERPWKVDAVLRLGLGMCICFLIGTIVLSALKNFGLNPLASQGKIINLFVTTLSFQGAGILLIAFFLREQNLTWRQGFGFGSRSGKAILLGLMAGLLILPVAWVLQHLTALIMESISLQPQSQEIVKSFQETVAKTPPSADLIMQQTFFGISVILIAPLAEELLFRGILYPTIKQAGYPKLALWGTSFLFAFLHNNGPSFLPFLLLAVLLVSVYEATDNLLAPILTHAFFNSANFLFLIYEEPVNRFLQGLT